MEELEKLYEMIQTKYPKCEYLEEVESAADLAKKICRVAVCHPEIPGFVDYFLIAGISKDERFVYTESKSL